MEFKVWDSEQNSPEGNLFTFHLVVHNESTVSVLVISAAGGSAMPFFHTKHDLRPYITTALLIAGMTILIQPFGLAFDLANISLIYLLPVLLNAVVWGLRPAFFAAFLGVLSFDFFFVPPVLSFTVADLRYLISFAVYIAVAVLTASLAARLKQQVLYSKQKEKQTATLYALSKQISSAVDMPSLLDRFSRQLSEILKMDVTIYLAENNNELTLARRSSPFSHHVQEQAELALAKRVYKEGTSLEKRISHTGGLIGHFIPLQIEEQRFGVMVLISKHERSETLPEQALLFEAVGGLAASAVARVKFEEEAKLAHLTAESERLRIAILNSVSHELRTPLAAIIGSATGLIDGEKLFTAEERMELLVTIRDGALRMNRLVLNLLGMARLEGGMLTLRKDECELEEIIGSTFMQLKGYQEHRTIRLALPDEIPIVLGDEALLEQMLINVISNAIKYSPDYSEIILSVKAGSEFVELTVADEGVGLKEDELERIFEKFYRSEQTGHLTGTGLGLAISKGIAELHGGTISAQPNAPKGAIITISLPLVQDN
ncbi:ATP-binding protein [Paenibacillus sp. GCM10012303]|jgi:two-component system sensor histidine kinase KdpD